jgi:hypothetical protein
LRLDLKGSRLALGWSYMDESCTEIAPTWLDEIWIIDVKGTRTLVARNGCENYDETKDSPALSSDALFYLNGRNERTIERFDLRTQARSVAPTNGYDSSLSGGDGALFRIEYRPGPPATVTVLRSTPFVAH